MVQRESQGNTAPVIAKLVTTEKKTMVFSSIYNSV